MSQIAHKAGFIGIVGKPNVGKSTFSNALIGERLSIISPKAQTTRHRILGLINDENYQLVISDTPGVIKPGYKLQEHMMGFVGEIFGDSDVIFTVIAMDDQELPEDVLSKLTKTKTPKILLINKCDLVNSEDVSALVTAYENLKVFDKVLGISAINGIDRAGLIELILTYMPEHPAFYPKDQLTDRSERFFVEEMVREGIFHHFKQEIPYATQVEVVAFQEDPKIIRIMATIFAERESQKGILIGPKGEGIKRIGIAARKLCEDFFGKQIFLDLKISIKKDWRKSDMMLKRFGYKNK